MDDNGFNIYTSVSLDQMREELESYRAENDPDYDDTISALEKVFDKRIEYVSDRFKSKRAMAEAIRQEARVLRARLQVLEADAERDYRYLERNLDPGEKFETGRCKIGWRKSEQVLVDESQLEFLDPAYKRIIIEPRKTELKKAIKAGETFAGVELVASLNLQVR